MSPDKLKLEVEVQEFSGEKELVIRLVYEDYEISCNYINKQMLESVLEEKESDRFL